MKNLQSKILLILFATLLQVSAYSQIIDTACVGEQNALYWINSSPGSSYNWAVEGVDNSISVNLGDSIFIDWGNTPGIYSISVFETNSFGCVGITTIGKVVLEPMPIVNLGNDLDFCEEFSINLDAGVGFSEYLWQDGSSSQILSVSSAGIYWVSITNSGACSTIDSININLFPSIELLTNTTNVLCYGDNNGSIQISILQGTAPYEYLWAGGQSGPILVNLTQGDYSLTVTDKNGCKADTIVKILQPDQISISAEIVSAFCDETFDGSIEITIDGGNEPYSYNWSNNFTSEKIIALQTGLYSVSVNDYNFCTTNETFLVPYSNETCFKIPNAFTPNNDGVNDTWEILGIDIYPKASIEIYNRWGQLLFKSENGYQQQWNGTLKGNELPIDTYYYVITLMPNAEPLIGNVSIVR